MKFKKRITLSSESSDDEALITLRHKKDPNNYHSLREASQEQCDLCDEVFRNRYSLLRHNVTHMIIPLIKKTSHQCKQCLLNFTSATDLVTHTSKYHKHGTNPPKPDSIKKETMPDILKSIVEKQVVVKCEDDINALVINKLLNENGSCSISKANEGKTHPGYTGSITRDAGSSAFQNIVKEEPLSPTFIKERASSPTDDEMESIRNRLLFEEDIEDSLFRDISSECQVNIETLCQEVSLDFEDGISISSNDSEINVFHDGMNNFSDEMNNYSDGMNNYSDGIDNHKNGVNNFERRSEHFEIKNFEESDFGNVIVKIEDSTDELNVNNMKNGANCSAYGVDYEYEIDNVNSKKDYEHNSRSDNLENGQNNKHAESQYVKAMHYNDLMVPDPWVCRYCKNEFPNRYQLLLHESTHLEIKKKHWSTPLCCICDRYISGNHHSLRDHIARKHPDSNPDTIYTTYRCPKCGQKFNNYIKHLRNYHEAYQCEKCWHYFDTPLQMSSHDCGELSQANGQSSERSDESTYSVMQLCDLCFSFMKIYMDKRHNYKEIGTKTELGVRQTCHKCYKEFFSVKLVKRRALRTGLECQRAAYGQQASSFEQKPSGYGEKASGFGQKASGFEQKASGFEQKASGFGQKAFGIGQKSSDLGLKLRYGQKWNFDGKSSDNSPKMKPRKPMTNKDRLIKIQNRLKLMKKINKC